MINLGKIVNRNAVVFSFSLILAGIGVFGARSYLLERADFYQRKYQREELSVQVVVPTRALRPGDVLDASLLSIREIPAKLADSNSLTQKTYGTALGKKIRANVDEGKPLLWAHVRSGDSAGPELPLAQQVRSGMRALTVRVDDVNSLSGFLQPGNRIDLLLSYRLRRKTFTRPVVERLEVIAIGNETRVLKTDNQNPFSTITVEVTPDQASRIILAQQLGSLTATLRHPDDDEALSSRVLTLDELANGGRILRRVAKLPPELPGLKPAIEYIVGGI